ncbi:hypothetical protein Rsub_09627 [Raphidocelis subcapitata]|uniref:Uncharacterized protein n=1 Tax=Raphidocelis subcapitata TaxID=307507 RepID=A0A2V0PA88_9CHLO|nr:hypothetical protein Rsub_09627 [Raphidocelis subcapitata]|eukprot:GBF96771.1 hypothetical protein Rsub_09627 [Raphidocelis subcapitata]
MRLRALLLARGAGAPTAPSRALASSSSRAAAAADGGADEGYRPPPRAGPGPPARSVEQQSVPGSWPPRSPDAPADPADKAATGRSADAGAAQETVRTAAWRASEAMGSNYDAPSGEQPRAPGQFVSDAAEAIASKVLDAARALRRPGGEEGRDEYYREAARKLRRDMEDVEEEQPPKAGGSGGGGGGGGAGGKVGGGGGGAGEAQ